MRNDIETILQSAKDTYCVPKAEIIRFNRKLNLLADFSAGGGVYDFEDIGEL